MHALVLSMCNLSHELLAYLLPVLRCIYLHFVSSVFYKEELNILKLENKHILHLLRVFRLNVHSLYLSF